MTPKVLYIIFALSVLMITGQQAHAELSAKESVTDEINYIYPGNKEKVFTETVDQFYEALRKRTYPVHQEFYRRHYEFYKKTRINSEIWILLFSKTCPMHQ